MMKFSTQTCGSPVSEDDVSLFEKFLRAPLPADYREFLLRNNGCIPSSSSDTFASATDLVIGNEFTVEQFYSLGGDDGPILSLYEVLEDYAEIVPITTFPIGHDAFGNVIGLDWESGQVNWTLCQPGYNLDLHRNFDLNVTFSQLIEKLGPGIYSSDANSRVVTGNHSNWFSRLKRLFWLD